MTRGFLLVTLLFPALAAAAPQPVAALAGAVRDASGAAVPGATIVVRQEPAGLERVINGQRDGSFSVASLTPGRYLVTVASPGFAPVTQTIDIPREDPLIVTLAPAPIVENVTVVSAARQEELRESLNTRVDVITRARIDEGGGQETVGEILRELPGSSRGADRKPPAPPASRFRASIHVRCSCCSTASRLSALAVSSGAAC